MSEASLAPRVDPRYQQIIDALPDLVYVVDRELRIVLINQYLLNSLPRFGLEQTPVGRLLGEVFPFLPDLVYDGIERVFNTGEVGGAVLDLQLSRDGEHEAGEGLRLPLYNDDGEIAWVAVLVRNRDTQLAAERALRRERDRVRAILEAVPMSITITDLEARVVDCNDHAWQQAGYDDREDYLGRNGMEFISEGDRPRALENMVRTFQQGAIEGVPYRFRRKDGSTFPGVMSASVVRDHDGEPAGYVAAVRVVEE